jgi:hypothetical protein
MSDRRRAFLLADAQRDCTEQFANYQRAIIALGEAVVAANKAADALAQARDALIDAWQHEGADVHD